jgi:hypothetical protein
MTLFRELHDTLKDIVHRPVSYSKHDVSETGLCLRLQVEPTQVGLIDRASLYLRTPATTTGFVRPTQLKSYILFFAF